MLKIINLCFRSLKYNSASIHLIVNRCLCSYFSHNYLHTNVRPIIKSNTNFKQSTFKQPQKSVKLLYAFAVAGLLKFLGLNEDEESELIKVIRRAEVEYLKKEYNLSEKLFHVALRIAQSLQNEDGVTYVYDRLANLAFDTGNNEKARKLFVSVLQRLLEKGMDKEDLAIIHISFKLAKIFESGNDFKTAETGYQYCLDALKPKLTRENPDYDDAIAIWLMLLNGYAYYLFNVGRLNEALEYFRKAYDVCAEIGGENQEQIVLILNNLGTVSRQKGDADSALTYFHKAEKIGKNFPDMDNFSYVYLNLGYLYMENKMMTEAKLYCEKALTNATRLEYEEGKKESEECLGKIVEALKQ